MSLSIRDGQVHFMGSAQMIKEWNELWTTVFNQQQNNMNTFSTALEALKDGKKVMRGGWNGKVYLYLVPAGSYPVVTEIAREEFGESVPYTAYIAVKTAQGDVSPWQPSNNDMLSKDWIVL